MGVVYESSNLKMDETLLDYIQNDRLTGFRLYIESRISSINDRVDDLNIYQMACVLGSVKIVKYLDNNGFGFLGEELDAVSLFMFN